MEYEVVHEIKNLCPNNQMRDIFFTEVETDDPVEYVRRSLTGERIEICVEQGKAGAVTIHACVDGLNQTFTFTPF